MATYTKQCTQVGSFSYANLFTLYVVLTEKDTNIANNTSSVDYSVYCQSSGSGSINSSHLKYFNINGSDKINKTETVNVKSPNAYISIASGNTGAIAHNSDGTKSINFSARIQASSYGVSASLSGTFTLSTIPRTSTVSFPTTNIGSSNNITINRASNSFTHTLTYSFGSLSGTIATKTTSTSVSWTIPDNFYSQIPNVTTGTGAITCITYSGNTEIGRSTCQLNANAVSSVAKPTVSTTLIDASSAMVTNITGNNKIIVLNASTARLTINTTLNKNAGSVSSITVNNTNISSPSTSRTLDYPKPTTSTFNVSVTDSRGYTTTSSPTGNTFINYIPLSLSASFFRPQPTTGEVKLQYSGNYWIGNFGKVSNAISVSYKYKEQSVSTWTNGTVNINPTINTNNTYTRSAISLGTNFDYTKQYDFQLYITDRLNSLTYTATVSQGLPIIQWNKTAFNVNGSILRNGTSIEEFYSKAGTPSTSANFDRVDAGQDLYRSGLYSYYVGGAWYNLINVRHRNGLGDGNKYGMQIVSNMTNLNYPLQMRKESNGTWSAWENIYRAKELYSNESGTTGTITLSENAADFTYLEIYYMDNNNRNIHFVKVKSPNGKDVALFDIESYVENNYPGISFRSKRITISGTSITNVANTTGYLSIVNRGFTNQNNTDYVKIIGVVGYR